MALHTRRAGTPPGTEDVNYLRQHTSARVCATAVAATSAHARAGPRTEADHNQVIPQAAQAHPRQHTSCARASTSPSASLGAMLQTVPWRGPAVWREAVGAVPSRCWDTREGGRGAIVHSVRPSVCRSAPTILGREAVGRAAGICPSEGRLDTSWPRSLVLLRISTSDAPSTDMKAIHRSSKKTRV